MECKIIIGLSLIFTSSFLTSGIVVTPICVQHPAAREEGPLQQCNAHWKRSGKPVLNDTSKESRSGVMKCYTRCLYEKMGIFYDGKFHIHMITEFVSSYVKDPFSTELLRLSIKAAKEVNLKGGNDCEMADNFWDYNNSGELKVVNHIVFCERDPWLNPE